MAPTKPSPVKTTASAPATGRKKGKASVPVKRGPPARVLASARGAARDAIANAATMPGWRGARVVIGDGLAAGDSALLLEAREKSVVLRRRVGDVWQPPAPLGGEDATAVFAALRKLSAPPPAGQEEPEFIVSAGKSPRRVCRVAARAAPKGEQVLVLLGPEAPPRERLPIGQWIAAAFGRLVPAFLRGRRRRDREPEAPLAELAAMGSDAEARQAAVEESDAYGPACDLIVAAMRERANAVVFVAGPQGVVVQFDVDGVTTPAPQVDPTQVGAIAGVFKDVAGLDPKERGPQSAKITVRMAGKSWSCTVSGRRGTSGERLEIAIDHMRPKFKTLPEGGMPEVVAAALQKLLDRESGLIILTGPRGGGLSTLFDGVINSTDRLLRDFIILEDAAAPRPNMQNVKPVRWDARQGLTPEAVIDAALREDPNVIATCDLQDAALAKRLVAQATQGRLVIVGVRAADAADGIARLIALGVDPQVLARGLLGAVGVQLVRKLCPKCKVEYFPTVETMLKLKRDPDADVTLFRAAQEGCSVCTGTGYLGRTATCELAAGATLQAVVAGAADASGIRRAAVKDGMVTVQEDAIDKATRGITSIEEVQRVFSRR